MPLIPLTQGKYAIVDDSDYALLNQWKWYYRSGYAVRTSENIRMHRFILNAPKGFEVDHINGNGLDNRRCNIRIVTKQQNQWNRGPYKCNKTGFKGVSRLSSGNFQAAIRKDKKLVYLGFFSDPSDASLAYCKAAAELHGEFARTVPYDQV